MPQYIVESAAPTDLVEVYAFLFSSPHPNLRQLSIEELTNRMERGVMLVARSLVESGRPIVGACFLAESDSGGWELGGTRVLENHGHKGLATFMAQSVIAIAFLSRMLNPEVELVGHVLVSNPDPRPLLESLGFELVKENEAIDPESLTGIAHMVSEDGLVHADTFHLSIERCWDVVGRLEQSWEEKVESGLILADLPILSRPILRSALDHRDV